MPEIPYQDDQVIEVLIEGAPDWIPVVRGSFKAIEVAIPGSELRQWGILTRDQMDGKEIFFYANRLAGVKFSFEDTPHGVRPADGRILP